MPRAVIVPRETDLLCEKCGYILNGLPDGANCPECGVPTSESLADTLRRPAAWEDPSNPRGMIGRFLTTTVAVLFHPTRFHRTLVTRGDTDAARRFARGHWILAALFLGTAATAHATWYWAFIGHRWTDRLALPIWIGSILFIVVTLSMTTWLAARLTHWEATYRGLRMPLIAVRRGMYYHAAHYLPVAATAMITVLGFRLLLTRGILGAENVTTYLYILSGEVVVAAGYLFNTYWIGMRNMMYANR